MQVLQVGSVVYRLWKNNIEKLVVTRVTKNLAFIGTDSFKRVVNKDNTITISPMLKKQGVTFYAACKELDDRYRKIWLLNYIRNRIYSEAVSNLPIEDLDKIYTIIK